MTERRPSATRLAGYDIGSPETPAAVIIRRHPDGHLSADVSYGTTATDRLLAADIPGQAIDLRWQARKP